MRMRMCDYLPVSRVQSVRERPQMTRVDIAVNEGAERFWQAVAETFPEVTSGDFTPADTARLETALREAVEQWLFYNSNARDEADSAVPRAFCGHYDAHGGHSLGYGWCAGNVNVITAVTD